MICIFVIFQDNYSISSNNWRACMEFMTFNDMLRRAAWRLPEHTFIHWSDRNRSISYAQGEMIANQAAGALAELGVQKGDRVGIFAHNGLDYVTAMFGIWKLGAISAHISVLQKDNLEYFIRDASPRVLIYTGDMHEVITQVKAQNLGVKHFICFDGLRDFAHGWSELLAAAPVPPEVKVSDLDAAHLSYTSGSSGAPKGALLAHGYTARATHTIAERLDLSSADVSLGVTSLSSSFHLVANLLPGVHRAMSIGVRKDWNPAAAWQEMNDRGVTFFAGNPLVLGDLLKVSREKGQKPRALTRCISGGAPLPPDVKLAFSDDFEVQIVESYGQSELGGFVALGYPRREPGRRFNAIGPGLPDRETIVADEAGHEVPMGHPGELLIRNNVMIGYWNMPEKTSEVLRDGWLHTGDMGVMDEEGYFTLLGRWSERIIVQGRVIFPRYMEEALLKHPAVHYSGVIAREDAVQGQIPLGIVELYPGETVSPAELMAHCHAFLGAADSPHEVLIIDKMPMTPTGKIGKQELIRLYGKPA
jgi:acyl-CoA synthetase (AMP-forming)/AMP-acid ligase II